jgi:hypothetical protein
MNLNSSATYIINSLPNLFTAERTEHECNIELSSLSGKTINLNCILGKVHSQLALKNPCKQ